jgi:hypothetical protein
MAPIRVLFVNRTAVTTKMRGRGRKKAARENNEIMNRFSASGEVETGIVE